MVNTIQIIEIYSMEDALYSDKELCKALNEWAEDKNLSARKIADLLNVSHPAVGRWMNGTKIRDSHKKKLIPHLRKYLSQEESESSIPNSIREAYDLLKKATDDKLLVWMLTTQIRSAVTAFSELREKELNTPQEPIRYTASEKLKQALKPIPFDEKFETAVPAAAGTGIDEPYISPLPIPMLQAKGMELQDIKVEGESMEPTLKEGSTVWMKPVPTGALHLPPTSKPQVPIHMVRTIIPNESIVLVNLNGAGRMLKRIHYEEDKGSWTVFLSADNSDWEKENDFPVVVLREDDLILYGEIVGVEGKREN